MKKNRSFRFLYIWLAMLLAASFMLPLPAFAEATAGKTTVSRADTEKENTCRASSEKDTRTETKTSAETELQVIVQDAGQKKQDAVNVNGLRITVKEETETEAEKESETRSQREKKEAFDSIHVPAASDTAIVITAEGITWEIPLFWMDDSNMLVEKREPGRTYKPVLAFFVPAEYAVQNDAEKGFTVTLDAWLSGLYEKAGGAVCFYEPETNITYIAAAGTDLSFLDSENGKLPAEPIPGLPDDLKKPKDGTYRNPSSKIGLSIPDEEEDSGRQSGTNGDPREQDSETGSGRNSETAEAGTGDNSSQTEEPNTGSNSPQTVEPGAGNDYTERDETDTENGSSQAEEPSKTDGDEAAEDPQGQGGEELPLTREQLLSHCAENTLNKYGEDEMANLVDLIINCIQPQAVELIKNKFPAFAGAAEADELGKEIGLYVYRMVGEKDGVKAHAETSSKALAYVSYHIDKDEEGDMQVGYILGVNTFYFQTRDKDGNLQIDKSEQAVSDLDNSIVHEMFHAFMCDYNRTGTIGTPDPEDYLQSGKKLQETRDVYEFPHWFKEGIASAVENNYQYRYEYFQLLRYEGDGTIGARQTAENLLKAYLTRRFLLEEDAEYEDNYDIGAAEETSASVYVTGYLADLYLGELAARQENTSSVVLDEYGRKQVSSEAIRLGLNSILERLHRGETLDQIIRSISDGRFQDVNDFEQKFIKGADQKGDQDSISFCVDFLNYMQDIGAANTYIPNGSILFDFDRDFTTPIDRSVTMETDFYKITDSSDYTASTVMPETPYRDGGKSLPQDSEEAAAQKLVTGSQGVLQSAKESNPAEEGEYSDLPDENRDTAEEIRDIPDSESAGEETEELTGQDLSTVIESEDQPEDDVLTDCEPAEHSEEKALPENEPAEHSEENIPADNEQAE